MRNSGKNWPQRGLSACKGMTTKCLDMETLCLHLDDELDARAQRDVVEHLRGCQSCADRLATLREDDIRHRSALQQSLLQRHRYNSAILATFLALFEPLYEDTYARAETAERVTLFRTGTWLENLYLAAAVGDAAAVQQGGQAVDDVRSALAQLQAPREVLAAIEQLQPLVVHQAPSAQDFSMILTLVQKIQAMLSE